MTSKCGNKQIIGGFGIGGKNIWFKKTVNLPPHKKVTLKFTAWAVDSWDNEAYIVKANGVTVVTERFVYG